MAAKRSTVMSPFTCSNCERVLGYTSPGEASRMGTRATIFCESCKDIPAARTERQQELIDTLHTLRAEGYRPTLAEAARRLGVGNSRVHQIVTALRSRGDGDILDDLLGRPIAPRNPRPETSSPAPAVRSLPPLPPTGEPVALSPASPAVEAVDYASPDRARNPDEHDPASVGAAME